MTVKRIAAWLLVAMMLAMAGCADSGVKSPDKNLPDINPNAESANKDSANVTLYFSYRGEKALGGRIGYVNLP